MPSEIVLSATLESAGAEAPSASFDDFLLATGKVTEAALDRARRSAEQAQEGLVPVLSKLGLMSEKDLVQSLSAFHRAPISAKSAFPEVPLFADRISRHFLLRHLVLPLAEREDGLLVAMADPGDHAAARALEHFAGRPIIRQVAALTDIQAAIERLHGGGEKAARADEPAAEGWADEDVDRLVDLASEAPVIRMVNGLIAQAVEHGASDIHIEPFDDRVRIRLRIDGVLREIDQQPSALGGAMASRVKIMARLNIAERRLPQDGRTRFAVRGKEVDLRVSTSPTVHGESVVLRLLDRGNLALDFAALGFDGEALAPTSALIDRPHGIVLVTGPTGSGKTTTLYAALLTLNTPDRKILTIEDPVEYQLDGINQQQVQPQIGRTFAGALRSFLRQDPDVIMVGEIRDRETAQIAVQAALTGHLILSTLHTNDAAGAMTRLLDMGVEDYLLTSSVAGILGQRLVRRLCPACREPFRPLPDLAAKLGVPAEGCILYRPTGCPACGGTGYHGRTTILEVLTVTDSVRRLVLRKAEAQDIRRAAIEEGMRTMRRHGLVKAMAGITSIEEVLRVTQEE